eukprot:TRINITY_DN107855_c0_g1_i1.p1 TRINITY_DN107855_c0_g1~~TRINITY_DN107855_c0_g1_i1.p1  ORF type:complete len:410 (-),score=86.93 TRINITY_DN107855_c0_g1_i1:105-1334(-)
MLPDMLPDVKAEDLQRYKEAILRFSDLMSYASVLPLILAGRFSSSRRFGRSVIAEGAKREDDSKEKGDQETPREEAADGSIPAGLTCLLLLLLSEVLGARSLLLPASGSKGKDSVPQKIAEALKKVQKTYRSQQRSLGESGALAQMGFLVSETLKTPEVFRAAHGVAMLSGLLTALISAGQACFSSGGLKGRRVLLAAAILMPTAAFAVVHGETLAKALRTLEGGEGLLSALQLCLRAVALVAAHLPGDEQAGTPAAFVVLQVGSITARLSAEVASGALAQTLVPFRTSPSLGALFDSPLLSLYLPAALALLWLVVAHLQRSSSLVSLAAILGIVSSPVALAIGWPKLAELVGMPGSKAGLISLLSMGYGMLALPTVMSGGAFGMMSVMLVLQALARIHGTDVLSAVLS